MATVAEREWSRPGGGGADGLDRLDALAERLEGVRPKFGGEGFMACCPAHDDREPSLSVDLADDGETLLVWDHGGCLTADVLAALGMTFADLGSGRRPPFPGAGVGSEGRRWERVCERALQQQWLEAWPEHWRYRAALFDWAECPVEAAACRRYAEWLEVVSDE